MVVEQNKIYTYASNVNDCKCSCLNLDAASEKVTISMLQRNSFFIFSFTNIYKDL